MKKKNKKKAVLFKNVYLTAILHSVILISSQREHSAPVNLQTETRNLALSMEEDSSLRVAMAAKDLKDLLHICTVICQGMKCLN